MFVVRVCSIYNYHHRSMLFAVPKKKQKIAAAKSRSHAVDSDDDDAEAEGSNINAFSHNLLTFSCVQLSQRFQAPALHRLLVIHLHHPRLHLGLLREMIGTLQLPRRNHLSILMLLLVHTSGPVIVLLRWNLTALLDPLESLCCLTKKKTLMMTMMWVA